jgi:hypothetical protein
MTDTLCGPGAPPAGLSAPVRNRYFYGKLLDAFHFELEQSYFNRKRALLNRLALGSGVLCGLPLAPTNDGGRVVVGPGVALDGWGREIVLPQASPAIDPRQLTDACGRPAGRIDGAGSVTICLAYHECPAEPAPVLVSSECDTSLGCAPSVTCEGYAILVRAGAPPPIAPGCGFPGLFGPEAGLPERYADLVDRISQSCPEPAQMPCVVLARIDLPDKDASGSFPPITPAMIDIHVRPLVYSNTLLFELLLCLADRVEQCCGPAPPTLTLSKVSGDQQSAPAGQDLPAPLVALAQQNGAPLAGANVLFEVAAGGGQIGPDPNTLGPSFSATTDGGGQATLPVWRLGAQPGGNLVRATLAGGAPGEVFFTAEAQALDLPVVNAIWPPNALDLMEDPALFDTWFGQPRIEITFSHKMDPARLEDVRPWLRLWHVVEYGGQEVVVSFLPLKYAGPVDQPQLGAPGFTEMFVVADQIPFGDDNRYLVQIRSENGAIVTEGPQPVELDAEFSGVTIEQELLDIIWDIDTRNTSSRRVWDGFVDTGARLPRSGEGAPGGRFTSWWKHTYKP